MTNALLRPDRQVADKHLGSRCPQRSGDVHGGCVGRAERLVVFVVRHVLGHPVEHRSHLNRHPAWRQDGLKYPGTVRLGEHRLLQRVADLASIDVECRNDLDVRGAPAADALVHQALAFRCVACAVVLDALNQRAGAVADAGNRDSNVVHDVAPLVVIATRWSDVRVTDPHSSCSTASCQSWWTGAAILRGAEIAGSGQPHPILAIQARQPGDSLDAIGGEHSAMSGLGGQQQQAGHEGNAVPTIPEPGRVRNSVALPGFGTWINRSRSLSEMKRSFRARARRGSESPRSSRRPRTTRRR